MKANGQKRKIFDAVDVLTEDVTVNTENGVQMIPVEKIRAFQDHPFRLYEGERLDDMVESVREHGILGPVIVRTIDGRKNAHGAENDAGKGNGVISGKEKNYEMLSGHNRLNAARIAGLKEVPAIVKTNLPDDLAYVYVIETNLMQRSFSDLLPSEKAAVIEAHYDKVCCQGKRNDILRELQILNGETPKETCGHNDHKLKNRDRVAEEYGLSGSSAARYLRLNSLIPEFKQMIDENKIAFLAAVDISFLEENEQQVVWDIVDRQGLKLKPKATAELRRNKGELTEEKIAEILDVLSVKKRSGNEGISLKLPDSICQKYFSGMKAAEMTEIVEKAIEAWFAGQKDH